MEQRIPNIKNFASDKSDISLSYLESDSRLEKSHRVFDYLMEIKRPISLWDLSKELHMPNSTIYYIIRDLEFANMVKTRISISKNNRAIRIVYIPKKLRKENAKNN